MRDITRRGFIAGSAIAAGLVGLAGCNAGAGSAADPLAAPAEDKYPIDPDKDGAKAKWASEQTRDGWCKVTNEDGGAELGVMDEAKIIQVGGYAFRDANGNGKLDLYEDWRQPASVRAKALADELSADEIIPLMWHNGFMSTAAPLDDDSVATLKEGMRAGVSRAMADKDNYAGAIAWINPHGKPCALL